MGVDIIQHGKLNYAIVTFDNDLISSIEEAYMMANMLPVTKYFTESIDGLIIAPLNKIDLLFLCKKFLDFSVWKLRDINNLISIFKQLTGDKFMIIDFNSKMPLESNCITEEDVLQMPGISNGARLLNRGQLEEISGFLALSFSLFGFFVEPKKVSSILKDGEESIKKEMVKKEYTSTRIYYDCNEYILGMINDFKKKDDQKIGYAEKYDEIQASKELAREMRNEKQTEDKYNDKPFVPAPKIIKSENKLNIFKKSLKDEGITQRDFGNIFRINKMYISKLFSGKYCKQSNFILETILASEEDELKNYPLMVEKIKEHRNA